MSERILLGDDGTLDTVVYCRECGAEGRYNFDNDVDDGLSERERETAYAQFVAWAIADFEEEHVCDEDTRDERNEPDEEDITTDDYQRFYYCGKCIVTVGPDDDWMPAVGVWCKRNGYFPDVWWISDHGNAHCISVTKDGRYLGGYADGE